MWRGLSEQGMSGLLGTLALPYICRYVEKACGDGDPRFFHEHLAHARKCHILEGFAADGLVLLKWLVSWDAGCVW